MTLPTWSQRCQLREDVRSGRLELHEFAADLNLVRQGKAPAMYQDPEAFFNYTYPSGQLKLLVRQVARRLADLPDGKPVIRMQVAYGGGKTHTLIALMHLAEQGAKLRENATVQTFLTFADLTAPPRARVALLPFDKFGFEEGLTVYDAEGHSRTCYTPWGALAYQLGGEIGLAMVNDDRATYVSPGEDRLVELLSLPHKRDGSGALILVDETLMYCRSAYNVDPRTLGTLKDFFQRLTQAVAHTPHCSLVATLVSSENEKHDATGIAILDELNAVFGRIEENIQPIERDDLPEVLRRRFFAAVPSMEERRPIVNAIMAALQPLAVRDSQKSGDAERRYLDAYPFHPELLDVLYQKWTQLPNYQRTRGALRLIGLALQEAVDHDPSPLITPAAFLAYRTSGTGLSSSTAEMLKATEAADQWRPILDGELGRARAIQAQYPALSERTVEQAVLATFLHSQPRGKRAETADLLGLLGYDGVDRISLVEGLKGWRESSWFLVEGDDNFWQLDLTPNLNQMHAAAMDRVKAADIEDEINRRVRAASALTQTIEGVRVYTLPKSPNDVEDSPEFRYLVLGPNHAVTAGAEPTPGVVAFFTDLSGPGNPRTYKNALVALAPDRAKLDGLREQVKRWKAWGLVQASDDAKRLSDPQQKKLKGELDALNGQIPSATQGAWSVMVLVDGDKSTGQRIALSSELLKPIPGKPDAKPFERIVHSLRESEWLAPDQIDPELLLPDSYLNLWQPGQTALKVDDLAKAFGQFLRLPRLLRPNVLYRSVARGAEGGTFVLRLVRSDDSVRTIWRETPSEDDLHRPELEIVPVAHATLDPLPETLLAPVAFSTLWPTTPADGVAVSQFAAYFNGVQAPRLADESVLERAIRSAVKDGIVMLEVGGDAYHAESLPLDAQVARGHLLPPPAVIRPADLGPIALPGAWHEGATTVGELAEALSAKHGKPIYWPALREALLQADKQQSLSVDTATERAAIPVRSRQITKLDTDAFIDAKVADVWRRGAPKLRELKSAIEYATGSTVPTDVFLEAARQAATEGKISLPKEAGAAAADTALDLRAQPRRTRIAAEAKLSLAALSDLPEAAQKLRQVAPEMAFEFVVTVSAEGETLSAEQIEQLNAILTKLSPNMRLS